MENTNKLLKSFSCQILKINKITFNWAMSKTKPHEKSILPKNRRVNIALFAYIIQHLNYIKQNGLYKNNFLTCFLFQLKINFIPRHVSFYAKANKYFITNDVVCWSCVVFCFSPNWSPDMALALKRTRC